MTTNSKYFSINDTLIYKGIGILLIVIHNYLHWQPGFGLENEDKFSRNNVVKFWDYLYPLNWTDTVSAIFGYLGHYGVQLFIFFSAYGLSVQLLNSKKEFKYKEYLFKRLKKLYFLLGFAIVLFFIFFLINTGKSYGFRNLLYNSLMLATSISNFRHSTLYAMFVGPFWFFGLMVQLYIIFPLLFFITKKYKLQFVFIGALLGIYALYYIDITTDFSLFGTIFGHLLEVILGITLALKGIKNTNTITFIICFIGFCLSQYFLELFPISFVCITVIMLYVINLFKPYFSKNLTQILSYCGEISMILFIVNGFFRNLEIFRIKDVVLRGERIFLYLILLFFVCHFVHKFYSYLIKKFKI